MFNFLRKPPHCASADEIYHDYLHLITLCNEHPDNYKYSTIRKELQSKCLRSPESVSDLIAGDRSNRSDTFYFKGRTITKHMRHELIFTLSMDDCRTCSISENPKWARFMREFVIPILPSLGHDITHKIKWFVDVHGL